MDIDAFSEERFDVKQWLNGALKRGKGADENVEGHVSSMVVKLQLFSQDLNRSLEEIGTRAVHNLPKTLRELERLKSEASALKQTTLAIGVTLAQVEEETRGCVSAISAIDSIKNKMEVVSNTLADAENVARIARDIDRVFSTGDLSQIADHLGTMQRSVKALRDVPEFDEYRRQVKDMQEKLESMVSHRLVDALDASNQDGAKMYRDVLTKIGRGETVEELYITSRQKVLTAAWTSYNPVDNVPEGMHNFFARWLASFYNHALSFATQENSWCGTVFPDHHREVLSHLLVTSFTALIPSFGQRIDGIVRTLSAVLHPPSTDAPSALEFLIDIFNLSANYTVAVRDILIAASCEENKTDAVLLSVVQAYVLYQHDYKKLETSHLVRNLADCIQEAESLEDNVRAVEESVGRFFNLATFAIERCIDFTGGTEAEALLEALSDVMSQYVDRIGAIVRRVRYLCHLDGGLDGSEATASSPKGAAAHLAGGAPSTGSRGAGSSKGLPTRANAPASVGGYVHHDWTHFQAALQLLFSGRSVLSRVATLETTLRSRLLEQRDLLFPSAGTESWGSVHAVQLRADRDRANRLRVWYRRLSEARGNLLSTVQHLGQTLYSTLRTLVYDTGFAGIRDKLLRVPSLEVWAAEAQSMPSGLHLPSFSLSPLEYITQIGEHLLTLPQQLEPFGALDASMAEDPGHSLATDHEGAASLAGEDGEEHSAFTDGWISAIAKGTVSMYLDQILLVPSLSTTGASQLATDIGYLCNVLSAVGVIADTSLLHAERLVSMPRDEFADFVEDTPAIDRKLAKTVATMRQIPTKS